MGSSRVLIYVLRRDLRLHDNPIFHEIARSSSPSHPTSFSHLLPLYVFPAQQVEVSGLLSSGAQSPFPEARSQVGRFWRCGPHRARFLAESVWDCKQSLEGVGSGLEIRAGLLGDVVKDLAARLREAGLDVAAVWMTREDGVEERREESAVRRAADDAGAQFRLWKDEKYFVDDDDLPFDSPQKCPDVFTSYKNMVQPLRDAPRKVLPAPKQLLPLPPDIPPQAAPFQIPGDLDGLVQALQKPLLTKPDLKDPPKMPTSGASSVHPFSGGATTGQKRLQHLLQSGAMTRYKDTRNGMLGTDFSSKLSAWLALGCVTAREIHAAMLDFEEGRSPAPAAASSSSGENRGAEDIGHGRGENKGTGWMRFELLWRDYMRLCARKFGQRLFRASGFRADESARWRRDEDALRRWLAGTTGAGLIDASMRELVLTGYTSNRARQNAASYLAKHLGLDWRLGAEWYESWLVDYDVSSNWGNWQYVAGVGNDPREGGGGRKFNPVKQADDYDPEAKYIKAWVPEVRALSPEEAFQCWKASEDVKKREGLAGADMAERPLVKINYNVRHGHQGPGGDRGRGRGRGGHGRGGHGRGGHGRGGGRGRGS